METKKDVAGYQTKTPVFLTTNSLRRRTVQKG